MAKLLVKDQRKYAFWFGCISLALIFAMIVVVFLFNMDRSPKIWGVMEFFFRVTMSISVAGVAAMLPGFFNIDWHKKLGLRAGGAFAVFLLVYTTNPPDFASDYSKQISIGDLSGACRANLEIGKLPSDTARNACQTLARSYPNSSLAHLGMAELRYAERNYQNSLQHARIAYSMFYLENGASVEDVLMGGEFGEQIRREAIEIVTRIQKIYWGLDQFSATKDIIRIKRKSGLIDDDGARLEKKMMLVNSLSLAFHDIDGLQSVAALSGNVDGYSVWEKIYDACINSWIAVLNNDEILFNKSKTDYAEFRSLHRNGIGRDLINQERYLDCLDRNGSRCSYLPGYPKSCPLFEQVSMNR